MNLYEMLHYTNAPTELIDWCFAVDIAALPGPLTAEIMESIPAPPSIGSLEIRAWMSTLGDGSCRTYEDLVDWFALHSIGIG